MFRTILACLFFNLLAIPTFAQTNLSITTWNLGLAHSYVRFAKQRIPAIVDALKNYNTDVLCVQEVWNQEDIDLLKDALKDNYAYNYSMPFKQKEADKAPACSFFRLFGPKSAGLCLITKCMKKTGDDLTNCVLNTCGPAIDRLKKKDRVCAEAFFAQVGKSTFKGILTVLNPFKKAGLFTYQGSNGLIMFSKYPMVESTGFNMDNESTLSRRSVLYSKIKVGESNQHMACTHLSANLLNVPYTGTFESWEDESFHQAKMMTTFVEEQAKNDPIFLTGDFNCSFEDLNAGVAGEATKTCDHFATSGYYSKMREQAECTFCKNNTLVLDDWETNKMIDHIFVKNMDTQNLFSEVIMKGLVTIKDDAGNDIQSNLSDHYGVTLQVLK